MLPSPFFYELAALATDRRPRRRRRPFARRGCWRRRAVVGRLRAVVCAPEGACRRRSVRACAAAQLARLAAGGRARRRPGGVARHDRRVSTDEPLWCGADHTVTLSPSTLQTLTDCPLRWLLERHGGTRRARSALGARFVDARTGRRARQDRGRRLLAELEKVWEQLPFESRVVSRRNELERHRAMLSTFAQWRAQTRHELTEVGTEVDVDGVLGSAGRRRARGAGARPHRPAGARRRGPAGGGRRQDRQEAGQQGRRAAPRPAGDVPAGHRRGAGARRRRSPAAAGWSISARPAPAGATEREQDALTPEAARRVARAGATGRGRDRRARSSSRASTTAARTARCGRCCPAQAAPEVSDDARATAPTELADALGLFRPPTSRPR